MPKGTNDRQMTLRIPLSDIKHATILGAYAPTIIYPDEIKHSTTLFLQRYAHTDKLIIQGLATLMPKMVQTTRHGKQSYVQKTPRKCLAVKWKGTSRQRSGKGAIRKRFPLQKPRWEKTKLTIRHLYHNNISKAEWAAIFPIGGHSVT